MKKPDKRSEDIAGLNEAIAKQTSQRAQLQSLVNLFDRRVAGYRAKIEDAQSEIQRLTTEVEAAPAKIEELDSRLAVCRRKYRNLVLGPKIQKLQELKAELAQLEREVEE